MGCIFLDSLYLLLIAMGTRWKRQHIHSCLSSQDIQIPLLSFEKPSFESLVRAKGKSLKTQKRLWRETLRA